MEQPFEIPEEKLKFLAVYDGHGDFGQEASKLANKEIENAIRKNSKKLWTI